MIFSTYCSRILDPNIFFKNSFAKYEAETKELLSDI